MDCLLRPKADPEIRACIVLGQNCLFGLKEDFWGEIPLQWSISIYCNLACSKVWKKKKNSLLEFWAQFSQNWQFGPKEDLWANFTSKIFIYLVCTIMLQSLKKILRAYPERDIGLHNFQLGQNYSIGLKEEFWGSFTITTFYLSLCKVWKNWFEWILRYRLGWFSTGPKLPIWWPKRFFGKFHLHDFYLFIALYRWAKFVKKFLE